MYVLIRLSLSFFIDMPRFIPLSFTLGIRTSQKYSLEDKTHNIGTLHGTDLV